MYIFTNSESEKQYNERIFTARCLHGIISHNPMISDISFTCIFFDINILLSTA